MNKPRRLWLIVPWVLFALLAAAWIAYWNLAANTARDRLAAWVAQQNARGAQTSYAGVTTQGFPVLLRLQIADASYAAEGGGWRATTPRLDLHVNLVNPSHLMLDTQAPIEITRDDGSRSILDADALLMSLRAQDDALAEARIEADALTLDNPAEDGVLSVEKLIMGLRPDPRGDGAFQLSFDATNLKLARPARAFEGFGQDIASLRTATVIENAAALARQGDDDPLQPWRDAGGRLRFEAIALSWGDLEASGAGEAALDAQRRVQGRLELTLPRPAPALAAFAQSPSLDDDARNAVRVFAVGYAISGDEVLLDIDARDGVLYVEGAPARQLDPLY